MENMKHRRLQELDRSDFEIVDGEPDIRGWDVRLVSGQKIGEVEDLIVDAQQKKVRYMIVDLDDDDVELDEREVLIPIGLATLDRKEDDVILESVTVEQLRSLPEYHSGRLDEEVERKICMALGRNSNTSVSGSEREPDTDFYRHDFYSDGNLYKNRLHQTEAVQNNRQESEYERGLRLWERRSEGGIIPESGSERSGSIGEDARMERVRNRRSNYEQRRYRISDEKKSGRSGSIEDRIKREGLR